MSENSQDKNKNEIARNGIAYVAIDDIAGQGCKACCLYDADNGCTWDYKSCTGSERTDRRDIVWQRKL